jgi:hypothetical protein
VIGEAQAYALTPSYTVIAIEGSGNRGTAIVRVVYPDGSPWFAINLYEISGDRISRSRTYFAPLFEPPEWRAPYRGLPDPGRDHVVLSTRTTRKVASSTRVAPREVNHFFESDRIAIGDDAVFTFALALADEDVAIADVVIDYRIHYQGANGVNTPKLFKLTRRRLEHGHAQTVTRRHAFKHVSIPEDPARPAPDRTPTQRSGRPCRVCRHRRAVNLRVDPGDGPRLLSTATAGVTNHMIARPIVNA